MQVDQSGQQQTAAKVEARGPLRRLAVEGGDPARFDGQAMRLAPDAGHVVFAKGVKANPMQLHRLVITSDLAEGAFEQFNRILRVAAEPFLIDADDAARRIHKTGAMGIVAGPAGQRCDRSFGFGACRPDSQTRGNNHGRLPKRKLTAAARPVHHSRPGMHRILQSCSSLRDWMRFLQFGSRKTPPAGPGTFPAYRHPMETSMNFHEIRERGIAMGSQTETNTGPDL